MSLYVKTTRLRKDGRQSSNTAEYSGHGIGNSCTSVLSWCSHRRTGRGGRLRLVIRNLGDGGRGGRSLRLMVRDLGDGGSRGSGLWLVVRDLGDWRGTTGGH